MQKIREKMEREKMGGREEEARERRRQLKKKEKEKEKEVHFDCNGSRKVGKRVKKERGERGEQLEEEDSYIEIKITIQQNQKNKTI